MDDGGAAGERNVVVVVAVYAMDANPVGSTRWHDLPASQYVEGNVMRPGKRSLRGQRCNDHLFPGVQIQKHHAATIRFSKKFVIDHELVILPVKDRERVIALLADVNARRAIGKRRQCFFPDTLPDPCP